MKERGRERERGREKEKTKKGVEEDWGKWTTHAKINITNMTDRRIIISPVYVMSIPKRIPSLMRHEYIMIHFIPITYRSDNTSTSLTHSLTHPYTHAHTLTHTPCFIYSPPD